ncbi:MAG TPA: HEAT repeat domain-containing protein [Bryobacteraceae bacterium]|nr:HEAT repeat domain-containing protein [Bryobacteraceae bacterium]
MKRADPVEHALNSLADLRRTPETAEHVTQLRAFLRNRSNLVVAKAAKLAGELRADDLIPDLVAAFGRFMADPARLDKRCAALTEIVAALYAMDYIDAADVYLRGIRHVQMEGSWGPPVDAAVQLRAHSAAGLIRTRDPDAVFEVVNLLADSESGARAGAARALACVGGDSGALLLRLKVLTGDEHPDVIAECFTGLLRADPERSVPFVARYLDDADNAIAEAAALALASTRSPAAVERLKEKWARTSRGPMRGTLLLALATAREESAMEFLLELIRDETAHVAVEVINALRVCRDDERARDAVRRAVEQRAAPEVTEAFHSVF